MSLDNSTQRFGQFNFNHSNLSTRVVPHGTEEEPSMKILNEQNTTFSTEWRTINSDSTIYHKSDSNISWSNIIPGAQNVTKYPPTTIQAVLKNEFTTAQTWNILENRTTTKWDLFSTLFTNESRLPLNQTLNTGQTLSKILCSEPSSDIQDLTNDSYFYDCNNNSTSTTEITDINWPILLLGTLVLLGVLGNILVIMAISMEKKLQTVTNYFLLSLAVADLLVSVIVMPPGMTQMLIGYWPLGGVLCDMWCFADVLMCTASIIHMCTISLDRYLGIRNPLKNRNKSRTVVTVKILVVWILSLAISSPVLILGLVEENNVYQPDIQYCVLNHKIFQLFGSTCAFIIPLVIMVVSYVLAVQLLQKQAKLCNAKGNDGYPAMRRSITRWQEGMSQKKLSRMNSNSSILSTGSMNCRIPPTYNTRFEYRKKSSIASTVISSMKSSGSPELRERDQMETNNGCVTKRRLDSVSSNESRDDLDSSEVDALVQNTTLNPIPENGHTTFNNSSVNDPSPKLRLLIQKHKIAMRAAGIFLQSHQKRLEQKPELKIKSVKTEQKASKVLGGVFLTFIVCWLPFFLTNILISVCLEPACQVDDQIMTFFVWLGYASSILNPVIYTIANKTFKRKFIAILTCHYQSVPQNHSPYTSVSLSGGSYKPRHLDTPIENPISSVPHHYNNNITEQNLTKEEMEQVTVC